jgi:RNA polymerase sigma factor (sigma-70 family)
MEASTLRHASRRGLLGRRSPLLRLQGDERLVALIRAGHDRAFEVLFDRYHARLLAFCRHMVGSAEDAEDVLQEVFANAHAAMLDDRRHINVRPWLYRIARNRCLNHLRKPVPEGQESMDVHPHAGGTSTAERVQSREDFRALVADVHDLPETQRTALLLREVDALSYEDIASAMDTTVPAVKSLLVRARMALADATQSRLLTCGDVRLELAEAAEGLRKASGAVRHHVRQCEPCREYRSELRANGRALASLAPAGLLVWLHALFGAKLFGGLGTGSAGTAATAACGSTAAAGGGSAAGGAAAAGGATVGGAAAAAGSAAGGITGVLGAKAAAGLATAALLTAGAAVEVRHLTSGGERGGAEATPPAKPVSDPAHGRSAATASAAATPATGRASHRKSDGAQAEDQDAAAVQAQGEAAPSPATEGSSKEAAGTGGTAPPEEDPDEGSASSVAGPAAGGSGSSDPEAGASGEVAIITDEEDSSEDEPAEAGSTEGGSQGGASGGGEKKPLVPATPIDTVTDDS